MNVKHATPVYRDPAVLLLERTSKAVLIDLLIDLMRTRAGRFWSCDDPVSIDEAREMVERVASWPRVNGMGQPLATKRAAQDQEEQL